MEVKDAAKKKQESNGEKSAISHLFDGKKLIMNINYRESAKEDILEKLKEENERLKDEKDEHRRLKDEYRRLKEENKRLKDEYRRTQFKNFLPVLLAFSFIAIIYSILYLPHLL